MAAPGTLGLALLLACSGCALAGRTLGGYVDDTVVKGAVKWRLAQQGPGRPRVDVDTYDGTVYLTGTVETELQKTNAEIAAWQVEGVRQVVNDLVVRGAGTMPAALPAAALDHPLRDRLRGVARVEPGRPGGPELAYDRQGRVIATVYTISSRELADRGVETLRGEGRPIDHVELLALVERTEQPAPRYAVVLWHVSEPEAAVLR
jgi:hypothetical protein